MSRSSVNKPNPSSALDVVGNVKATGSLSAASVAAGGLVAAGSLSIGSDPAMTAAPHMYLTGYVPGPLPAGASVFPVNAIMSKAVTITRVTSTGTNTCPGSGALTFSVWGAFVFADGGTGTDGSGASINLNASIGSITFTDSGPLSVPIAAGHAIVGRLTAPNCGSFGTPPSDISVGIEYVMQ